jgi:hypothetical protein
MHLFRTLQPVCKTKDLRHDEETLQGCWDHTVMFVNNETSNTENKDQPDYCKHDELHKWYNPSFDDLEL